MRNLQMFVAAAVFTLFSSATAWAAEGWSAWGYITEIDHTNAVTGASNGIWIITDSTIYNDNCSGSVGSYFMPDEGYSPSNTKYKTELAMVMAAYMNNKPIAVYIKGCNTSSNNPLVGAVRIGQ